MKAFKYGVYSNNIIRTLKVHFCLRKFKTCNFYPFYFKFHLKDRLILPLKALLCYCYDLNWIWCDSTFTLCPCPFGNMYPFYYSMTKSLI